jgi:glycosyltransferase involved in cell wall biosynthesis
MLAPRAPKLLFFVTEDYYFVSHRLRLAVAAQAAGYDVAVVTRVRDAADVIRDAGIRVIPFENERSSFNALREVGTLLRLVRVYRRERPDVLHHVAMKPVLYGSIAARITGQARVINALAGMGWLFTSAGGPVRWLMPMVRTVLGSAAKSGTALVQNVDDEQLLVQLGVPRSRIRRIPGSGVDLDVFRPSPEVPGPPIVVMPSRLLADKGLLEFVAAARMLRQRGIDARFVVAGGPDALNPSSIAGATVAEWVREGIIDYAGHVTDVAALLARSHIVCLPSYREGLPKTLIEAASSGKPIVATDVPGCRHVVTEGENGLLVPPRDPVALADALQRLIEDAPLRRRMGARGRARAEAEFGIGAVIDQTLALYREALA